MSTDALRRRDRLTELRDILSAVGLAEPRKSSLLLCLRRRLGLGLDAQPRGDRLRHRPCLRLRS